MPVDKSKNMVKFRDYLTYRGGPGQWSWILHRLTGVCVFLFLLVHIADIALVGWGPAVFNKLLFLYRYPPFRVGEIILVGAVVYHALNGLRICIIDFWPQVTVIHRKLVYAVGIVFVVIFIPTAIYMLSAVFK
ncbi:MAG TPA: succinate dehydrogenase, cytochrome b556 subunit [Candidatus Acidoferrum sp.]|nr:succinate dehydrogenase, cytochrome b556 subunit [Candidatus Acidoferrum sp.]